MTKQNKLFAAGLTATHNIIQSFAQQRFGNITEGFAQWQQAQIDNPPVNTVFIYNPLFSLA